MANRFPLILNTSSNQIQELASGDTLDLTGSGLNLTGITTLSSSAELNLQGGTNLNTGTRGDILFYNASGTIQKLSLGAAGKVLKSNGSDLVYGDTGSIANVYYVSPSGTDASGFGAAIDRPFASIKYACSNIGTPTATAPAIIFVKAGVYEEGQLPIVVPAHTTIAGDSLRATIIKPASGLDSGGSIQNNRSTMFKMSNATVLQDLVMDGMGGYTPGSPNYKPESATVGGIYLALNNASPVTTKSPYIYNCTSFGNGATGAVLDGSVHSSGNRSMLFHTYTAVHSDGLGIWLKNNANAEMISTFTYYCTIGLAATGGSKIRSLNSSNAYGEYGVYSAGFDAGESANQGTIKGQMLVYTNVLTTSFTDGEQVTGGTSGATGYVVNVQAEPKRIYIVQRSGTFQSSETVTGGSSGATATLTSGTATVNQSGRILVTTFSTTPDAGDSLQFASTDGNAYQIQSVSSVTANSVAYKVLVFSTSRATAVAENVNVLVRKEFSLARLTGHDFLQIGTGGTDTTNWPNNPTQNPAQADQVVTNETDPGRVYYTATDELGNFYVGDQFKVDQATGNVTLDASAFNLSGLESLRLGSVGGLIGAAVGEFSTDVTLSQNSDTKVSTQKAVKTYVDTLDDVTPVGGTFTVAGISTVTGTTQFTKQLNVSGVSTFHGNVNLLDGDRLRVGSSQDLQVYHDGNHSYIAENGGGDLKIQASAGSIFLQKDNGEEMIKAIVDGAVELYYDDTKRLETRNNGIRVLGTELFLGNSSDDLRIHHNQIHSYIDSRVGNLYLRMRTAGEPAISCIRDGAVEIHYDSAKKLETTNTGISVTGNSVATGNVSGVNGTFSGNVSGVDGTFSGNVSIGGTLTYEDVSNIDSVGVVTARNGLKVTGGTSFFAGAIAAAGAITGTASTATNVTVADESSDTTCFPTFVTAATGNLPPKTGSNLTFNSSNGTLTATSFVGDGAGLSNTGSSLSEPSSGTHRIVTTSLTSGTMTSSGTDSVLSFNYSNHTLSATNFSGNGSGLTNVNATTLDSIDSGSFLRSDADDTMSGRLSLTTASQYPLTINSSNDAKIVLEGSSSPYIRFRGGSTDKAYLQYNANGNIYLWNQNHNKGLQMGGSVQWYDGSSYHNIWHAGNDGSGSGLDADTLDGTQGGAMIRGGAQNSVSGWHISAYRNGSGTSPHMYFSHSDGYGMHINTYNTSSSIYALELNNSAKELMKVMNNGECLHGGTVYPGANNTYDLGTSNARWRDIYTNDLNLSNEGGKNDVDGSWGSYTIQEGESDLFLINKRNGKKYKFNLTEVS